MVLKYFEISNIISILGDIAKQDFNSVKVKYRISKLLKDLSPHFNDFQEARRELIDKYAEKDEEGNYKNPEEEGKVLTDKVLLTDVSAYNSDMLELANMEIELTLSGQLDIDDLEKANINIPFDNITVLQPILKES